MINMPVCGGPFKATTGYWASNILGKPVMTLEDITPAASAPPTFRSVYRLAKGKNRLAVALVMERRDRHQRSRFTILLESSSDADIKGSGSRDHPSLVFPPNQLWAPEFYDGPDDFREA